MTPRLAPALLTLALLMTAACSAPDAPAPDTTVPAATAPAPAAPATDAATSPATPAADPAAAAKPEPSAAETAAAAAAQAASVAGSPALVPGTDYIEIKGGQPYLPLNGKIEVVEVFGYVCPACAAFQPLVNDWKAKLPADVRFTYVPAPFGPEWIPYAKAYYVAEQMGLVDKTHDAVIQAIHVQDTLPGEGDGPDEAAIAAFYGNYGVNPKEFLSTMSSFAIDAKVNRGKQFMIRSGASSTPTIIVNGKYRVEGATWEDRLRITNQLIVRERAARG